MIALTIKNPLLAVPLSFVSHYVQDLVPHFDHFAGPKNEHHFERKFNIALVADFLLSILLMIVLAILLPSHKWLIWGCMVAAACPDLGQSYYYLYVEHIKKQKPKFDPLSKLHYSLQWSATPKGFFVELAWFVLMGTIILALR